MREARSQSWRSARCRGNGRVSCPRGSAGQCLGCWTTEPLTPSRFKPAGVNVKLPAVVTSDWTRDLAGPTVATATLLLHPDGSVVAAPARATLTGTVAGVGGGTLDFVEEARGHPDGSTQTDAASSVVRAISRDCADRDLCRHLRCQWRMHRHLYGFAPHLGDCSASGALVCPARRPASGSPVSRPRPLPLDRTASRLPHRGRRVGRRCALPHVLPQGMNPWTEGPSRPHTPDPRVTDYCWIDNWGSYEYSTRPRPAYVAFP